MLIFQIIPEANPMRSDAGKYNIFRYIQIKSVSFLRSVLKEGNTEIKPEIIGVQKMQQENALEEEKLT